MDNQKKGLLARVGHYYYLESMSQGEIAKRLNIHRSTVSRMLQMARDEGIVQININYLSSELFAFENYFREKFGLNDLVIVSNHRLNNHAQEEMFYEEAAYYLHRIINDQKTIGITWGTTLGKTFNKIDRKKQTEATFVPLVGGPSHIKSEYHVNSLVYELAERFVGESIFINASAVQETESLAQGILESRYFESILHSWANLDLAIVSVGGAIENAESQWRDLLSYEDRKNLEEKGAMGDCCCRFYDEEGVPIQDSLNQRTIGISLEELKKVPESVVIAKGSTKVPAILALLKANYFKSLVTDYNTAIQILKLDNDPNYKKFKEN